MTVLVKMQYDISGMVVIKDILVSYIYINGRVYSELLVRYNVMPIRDFLDSHL